MRKVCHNYEHNKKTHGFEIKIKLLRLLIIKSLGPIFSGCAGDYTRLNTKEKKRKCGLGTPQDFSRLAVFFNCFSFLHRLFWTIIPPFRLSKWWKYHMIKKRDTKGGKSRNAKEREKKTNNGSVAPAQLFPYKVAQRKEIQERKEVLLKPTGGIGQVRWTHVRTFLVTTATGGRAHQ